MDWSEALIGARMVIRVPSGFAAGETVELVGVLLGRGRFDSAPPYNQRNQAEHAARIRLDDGTVVSAPVSALVRRA
jgi:hypothetical protein